MSQRLLGWVLFCLLFVVCLCIAWQILDDLPDEGMEIANSSQVDDFNDQAVNLWFDSLKMEKEANAYRTAEFYAKAFSKLDESYRFIQRVASDTPGFHPDLVQDRLETLEELKASWHLESRGYHPLAPEARSSDVAHESNDSIPKIEASEVVLSALVIWFRAHAAVTSAESLESKGEYDLALQKYRESQSWYEKLAREFPTYQEDHVASRMRSIAGKLNLITQIP